MSPGNPGDAAPDFTLKDQNNQEVRLADFRGRKAVLLVFYPLAFSRTCQGELTEVAEHLDDFWPHGAVARAYGVFNDVAGFANRGTFVIDDAGAIRFAEMLGPGETRDQQGWRAALASLRG